MYQMYQNQIVTSIIDIFYLSVGLLVYGTAILNCGAQGRKKSESERTLSPLLWTSLYQSAEE